MKLISKNLREQIRICANSFLDVYGEVELNMFYQKVLRTMPDPINYKDYVEPGSKLKAFFELLTDILFLREIKEENTSVWYCSMHGYFKSQIAKKITEAIKANEGSYPLPLIPGLLKDELKINNYKSFSEGKNLSLWLKSEYPDMFTIKENYIFINSSSATEPDPEPSETQPQIQQAPIYKSEIAQMHHLSFMNWWSSNSKKLQQYTMCTYNQEEWSRIVARGLSNALLGINALFNYTVNNTAKIVFDTGLKTVDGNILYCVLCANSRIGEGFQPFMMEDFCCPYEDASELSDEIKENIPGILKTSASVDSKYAELHNVLEQLIEIHSLLLNLNVEEAIFAGLSFDAKTFNLLKQYYNKWEQAKEIIDFLGWDIDEDETINLEFISNRLEYTNQKNDLFNKAVDIVLDVFGRIMKYCTENRLVSTAAIVEEDIRAVSDYTPDSYRELNELIDYYLRLSRLAEENEMTDEVLSEIDIITSHFKNFKDQYKVLARFFINQANEPLLENSKELMEAVSILSMLDTSYDIDEEELESQPIDTDRLFDLMANKTYADNLVEVLSLVPDFPKDRFERALASGNYDKAIDYLECEETTLPYAKSKTEILAELNNQINSDEDTTLTLYDCGMRIYNIIGNHNRTAEKYFIAGLVVDSKRCSEALLSLYISDNRTDKFYSIWYDYCQESILSPEEFKFLFCCFASKGEDVVAEYLEKKPYYYYVYDYARAIAEVLADSNYSSVLEKINNSLSYLNSLPAINEFEEMIIDSTGTNGFDIDAVKDYVGTNKENLQSLGYTDEEIRNIIMLLDSEFIEDAQVSPEEKLYCLQKNKNGIAERLIWESLLYNFDENNCSILLRMLAESERYGEICSLYECYEGALENNPDARSAYLCALFHTRNDRIYNFVRDNFEDIIRILNNTDSPFCRLILNAISKASFNENQEFAVLSKNIVNINNILNENILISIVLLSKDLREIAVDTEKLLNFGLDQKQISDFQSVYKTDSYSHERSIIGVAKRIFSFIGACKNIAEAVAVFAKDMGSDTVDLMWEIYKVSGNTDEQYNLFQNHPDFIIGKESEYCSILFEKGMFREFLDESEKADYKTDDYIVKSFIAECNLNLDINGTLIKIIDNIEGMSVASMAKIISAMVEFGYIDNYEDFIVNYSNYILTHYNKNEVALIISADGNANEETLKKLQKKAVEAKNPELVLYLYENFKIGRYKGASSEYINNILSRYASFSNEEKEFLFKRLQTIYSNNSEHITKIVLNEIEFILSCDTDNEIKREKIIAIIENTLLTREGLVAFMNFSLNYELLVSSEIWSAVLVACMKMGLQRECSEYIHKMPSISETDNTEILYSLCSLYIDALKDGYFNTEWQVIAENICLKLINTNYFSSASYCLYKIYTYTNNLYLAKFVLLFILDNKQKMSQNLLSEIESESDIIFEKPTDIYSLFVEAADHLDVDQLTEYCVNCNNFILDKTALFNKYYADSADAIDISLLVKLIFAQPNNVSLWKKCLDKMTSEENSIAYCKVLYKVALMDNSLEYWQNCIDTCERFAPDELLSEVILSCVRNISAKRGLYEFREYLCAKSEKNPLYFAKMNEQRLDEIISVMCTQMKEDSGPVSAHHNAIRDLSAIAIATDSARVFKTMINHLGFYLYETNTNLGFAVVCRLILKKRFAEARDVLCELSSASGHKYPKLVEKLSGMDISALAEWSYLDINNQLLQMILPDGNIPKIEEINELSLVYSSNGKAEDAANLICEIIDNVPKDYGCYMALFVLCKQLPHRIDLLHKALCGLIQNSPSKGAQSYYDRERKDYAVFLAKINSIIIAKRLTNEIYDFDGYDFQITAKDYYLQFENDYNNSSDIAILKSISDAQDQTQNDLMNQTQTSIDIISSIIWGSVTGSWYDLIIKCWETNFPLKDYMENYYEKLNSNDGLGRSILKVLYSLDKSERNSFRKWVISQFETTCKTQTDIALFIYNNHCYDNLFENVLEANIFDIPFEEYFLFMQIYNNTVRQFISKAPESVGNCAKIVGALIMEPRVMSEFWRTAIESFESFDNLVSYNLFDAMLDLNDKLELQHKVEKDTRKHHEVYESMKRVAGAFLGNDVIVNKISKYNFKPHSCINMIFALAYTNRADEINRLKQYFCESNQMLTDVLLTCLNRQTEDKDKFSALCDVDDIVSKGLLCYIILKRNYRTSSFWYLQTDEIANNIKQMYMNIAKSNSSNFSSSDDPCPKKFIWVEPQNINKRIGEQKEATKPEPFKNIVPVNEPEEPKVEVKTLSFVSHLTPSEEEDVTIDHLWEEHENIYSFGLERYESKLRITERLYRLALKEGLDQLALNDYAFRYGVDYYYNCIVNKNYSEANKVIIEMVNAYEFNRDSEGSVILKKVVCSTALYELLCHGYTTIYALIEDYAVNRQAFIRMRNMLPNSMSEEVKAVNNIYATLDCLEDSIANLPQNATFSIRAALFNAIQQLGSIGVTGWDNLKALVLRMIQDEINKIDKRPILTPEILSKTSDLPYGSIFGQIKNVGNDTAENITIQISYADNTISNPYFLPLLEKEETASFEIPYSAADGTTEILYDLMITYNCGGEQFDCVEKSNILTIEYKEFQDYDENLYLTDRAIVDFVVLDDGTVHSDQFFGREEEKRAINKIFNAESFINYKNVIIKGIRRAGKTSVLYYLKKYVEANCDDAIAIYTDCSGSGKKAAPVHAVFIETVIKECKKLNYSNHSDKEWQKFEKKWQLAEGESDCNPEDLQYFYREFKAFNDNRGIVLIIDEFDVLLEAVEQKRGVDSSLLASLRVLINNVYCQEAIHLIVCGSNKMIRYMDGGTFNQLFQQFGSNIIEIGRLLGKDMENMLTSPYERVYPFVKFTPEALDWIWRFTNGLVWYSKLIASGALSRARLAKRNVVYPSDVLYAVTGVVDNDNFFKSLVTSCTHYELRVMDAMQGVTAKASEYVPISKLLDVLSDEFTQKDIEGIINSLERMQVIEKNPYDRYSYRFMVPLYWRFFRKNPSNFNRIDEIPLEFKEKKQKAISSEDYKDTYNNY